MRVFHSSFEIHDVCSKHSQNITAHDRQDERMSTLQVIEVKANGRTGPHNFVTCMRQIVEKSYGDKPVGMGGTFVIQKGKAKIHIMVSCS